MLWFDVMVAKHNYVEFDVDVVWYSSRIEIRLWCIFLSSQVIILHDLFVQFPDTINIDLCNYKFLPVTSVA